MEFFFWQNIISIHQSAFLKSLSENNNVTLVVEKSIDSYRLNDGWTLPEMGRVTIIIAPSHDQVDEIICNSSKVIHVFSGIATYALATYALKFAIKKRQRVLVYSEPYNWLGFKGKLRWVLSIIKRIKYGKRIDAILVTGNRGMTNFVRAGYSSQKIFQFGYFVDIPKKMDQIEFNNPFDNRPSLLFVGSIDKNKNILDLVDVSKRLANSFSRFDIIGRGHLEVELKKKIAGTENIHYLGVLPNNQVNQLMSLRDILILPSLYDGWGAVVNEALQNGMRVIVSENCGSEILVDGQIRGETFLFSKKNNLEDVLKQWIAKGRMAQDDRKQIIDWCNRSISGKAASDYFINICQHVYEGKADRLQAPWIC